LGDYVSSPLIIGHVRAASSGHDPYEDVAISTENCHPFKYGRWTFVHNGSIPHFKKIKRAMIMLMKDECFHDISGSTDSECIFALFLSLLPDRDHEVSLEVFKRTINYLIATILELCSSSNITPMEPCSLNMCITDGVNLIATRFRSGCEQPPSLYYKYGSEFKCVNGNLYATDAAEPSEIIIASAPLSREGVCPYAPTSSPSVDPETQLVPSKRQRVGSEYYGWNLVPKDHMLICVGDPSEISKVTSIQCESITAEVGNGLVYSTRRMRYMSEVPSSSANPQPVEISPRDAFASIYEAALNHIDIKILTGAASSACTNSSVLPAPVVLPMRATTPTPVAVKNSK
jgi:predicted glutamine amidotransferase